MKCGWDCELSFVRSEIHLRAELPVRMLKALTTENIIVLLVLLFHYPKEVVSILYQLFPFVLSSFGHTQGFMHSHWPHNPWSVDFSLLNDTYVYLTQPAWFIFRRKRSGPPMADSLAQMLIQALHSQDNTLLEVRYLTIILQNRAEYRLILGRRGRRLSRLKSGHIPQDWAG